VAHDPVPPIDKKLRVRASQERAFLFFTTNSIRWWPPTYTIGNSPMKEIVLEPHVGGRWYEIGEDGSECQWGDVLAWDAPNGLTLAWRINLEWAFDPALLTEIAISFTDVGNGETEVRIVHSKFENLGERAPEALRIFDGWSSVLARFKDLLEAQEGKPL
jgi:uncharacterized protein YndB with AHSA1/START domain